jgi:hypothetical protein
LTLTIKHKDGSIDTVLFDRADASFVLSHRWCCAKVGRTSYTWTKIGGKQISMHLLIMNPPKGLEVDHVNGNGLDNRRKNLRSVSHVVNLQNRKISVMAKTSRYRGVCWRASKKHWRAYVYFNGKYFEVGTYKDEKMAAMRASAFREVLLKTATGRLSSGEEQE